MSKSLLETGKDRFLVAGLDINHPVGWQAGLRNRWRKEIRLGHTPEYLSACSSSDSSREQRCGGTVDRSIAASGHLMQASNSQSSSRQNPVDFSDSERQNRAPTRG